MEKVKDFEFPYRLKDKEVQKLKKISRPKFLVG